MQCPNLSLEVSAKLSYFFLSTSREIKMQMWKNVLWFSGAYSFSSWQWKFSYRSVTTMYSAGQRKKKGEEMKRAVDRMDVYRNPVGSEKEKEISFMYFWVKIAKTACYERSTSRFYSYIMRGMKAKDISVMSFNLDSIPTLSLKYGRGKHEWVKEMFYTEVTWITS